MTAADSPVNILLVDDLQENLVALEALLHSEGRRLFSARSADEALSLLLEQDFGLALVDVQMPGMSGFELAETMRSTERTRRIPIIFVTAAGREMNYAFKGYESGAVDFLYKPLDPMAVRSKVNVFEELTRQRQALQAAQAGLERAVRMRDDFMSIVSHELRTPLNTLFLQTQLRRRTVEKGLLDPAALLRSVDQDERQIRNMVRLIDDMLDVSRLRTGRLAVMPRPADLAALVKRVVDGFADQAQAAGSPITLRSPAALPVHCDEFRIEQVLSNLLTNALRYGAGKPVDVELRDGQGRAELSVRDRGLGIAAQDQERIFEQFERAPATEGIPGLGLGLFIARQIVAAHGGRIQVSSTPGDGAHFTVLLPTEGPPADAEPVA